MADENIIILKHFVVLQTSKGEIKAELFLGDVPVNTENFIDLVKAGFYDGLAFFKKVDEFYIQTGCPNNDGTGGPGYYVKCELDNERQAHEKGVLSMAHTGRDMNGSQFFICLDSHNVGHLDGNHTCFGKIVENEEVLDELLEGDVIEKAEIQVVKIEPENF